MAPRIWTARGGVDRSFMGIISFLYWSCGKAGEGECCSPAVDSPSILRPGQVCVKTGGLFFGFIVGTMVKNKAASRTCRTLPGRRKRQRNTPLPEEEPCPR